MFIDGAIHTDRARTGPHSISTISINVQVSITNPQFSLAITGVTMPSAGRNRSSLGNSLTRVLERIFTIFYEKYEIKFCARNL